LGSQRGVDEDAPELSIETAVIRTTSADTLYPGSRDRKVDLVELPCLDRPHEDIPLGRGQLHDVVALANPDLVFLDLDSRALTSSRPKREDLAHRCSPPFLIDLGKRAC
jgi:hypothetical protein